jgi:hypothetical protein
MELFQTGSPAFPAAAGRPAVAPDASHPRGPSVSATDASPFMRGFALARGFVGRLGVLRAGFFTVRPADDGFRPVAFGLALAVFARSAVLAVAPGVFDRAADFAVPRFVVVRLDAFRGVVGGIANAPMSGASVALSRAADARQPQSGAGDFCHRVRRSGVSEGAAGRPAAPRAAVSCSRGVPGRRARSRARRPGSSCRRGSRSAGPLARRRRCSGARRGRCGGRRRRSGRP